MADKEQYYIPGAGLDGNRTTGDIGDASIVPGFGGKDVTQPTDWGDLAYTAGGGALGYALSKWLMGDDDEDKNGKKKDNGILKSLIPWLSAAAGAYGGHLLSGSGLGFKGENGELAFKRNPDGSIHVPNRPWSGKYVNYAGSAPLAAAGVTAAGGIARFKSREPEMAKELYDDALADLRKAQGTKGTPKADLDAIRETVASRRKDWLDAKSKWNPKTLRGKTIGRLGKFWRRTGRLGGPAGFAAQLGLGGLLELIGHYMNSRQRDFDEAARRAGLNPEDYK